MMNKKYPFLLILVLSMVLFAFSLSFALEGEGEGNGENQDEALQMVSSNVKDGDVGVSTKVNIQLEFSKNVVHMTVADNNRASISLQDQEGNPVPIRVEMGDDQVDPTIKRLIGIVPVEELGEGVLYTLEIGEGFQSKSGTRLSNPIHLSFETERGEVAGVPENQLDAEGEAPVNARVLTVEKDRSLLLLFSVFCLMAGLILLVVVIRRRKNEK